MTIANKLFGLSVFVTIVVGFMFFATQTKADDFRPACINDPKGYDYTETLKRYTTNGRAFLTKPMTHTILNKLSDIWYTDPDYVMLSSREWNIYQVIITPEYSFSVRGKAIGDYVAICFTKNLTEEQVITLFGKTSKQMFEKSTDL